MESPVTSRHRLTALMIALTAHLALSQSQAQESALGPAPLCTGTDTPELTGLEWTRGAVGRVEAGQRLDVTFVLTNRAAQAVTYTVSDDPGQLLTLQETPVFTGTLAPGERRTLTYAALVNPGTEGQQDTLQATLSSDCGAPLTLTAPVRVAGLPVPEERRSTVQAAIEAPRAAETLVYAQALPAGATLVAGSSTYAGQPLPDPVVGPSGTLYWTLPVTSGTLDYTLAHARPLGVLAPPGLAALYPAGREDLLSGQVDRADRQAARPLPGGAEENVGAIRLPLDSAVFRERDQVTVVVEGAADAPLTPALNGRVISEDLIGTRSVDAARNWQRVEYVGVRLGTGLNRLTLGESAVTVSLAGTTTDVQVQPEQVTADGVTPVRVRLRAVDERGVSTALPFVTVRSSIEPAVPDANPLEAGYQVRLTQGEGTLELPPQISPARVTVDIHLGGGQVLTRQVTLRPSRTRVAVGLVSLTVTPGQGVTVQGRGTLETPLGDGKLIVAADSAGLPLTPNPLTGYAAHGDSSRQALPLQGADAAAFRYDHPDFRVQYRQDAAPIQTLSVPGLPTALSVTTFTPVQVSAFAALVPQQQVTEDLRPDGTRLLHLARLDIAPDSERVTLIQRGAGPDVSVPLKRGADYVLDPLSGTLTFARPLAATAVTDGGLRDVLVRVTYQPLQASGRSLAAGAEVRREQGPLTLSAAAVQMPGTLTVAARGEYRAPGVSGHVLAAYGHGLLLDAAVQAEADQQTLSVTARHQDDTYTGLNAGAAGTQVTGAVSLPLNPAAVLNLSASYDRAAQTARGELKGTVETRRAAPFGFGAGLKQTFGASEGLSALGTVTYRTPDMQVNLTHTQPLTGEAAPVTTLASRYRITPQLALILADEWNWSSGHAAAVSLESKLGGTNLSAQYDLPGSGGSGNRARFGADTTLALNDRLSLNLSGAYVRTFSTGDAAVSGGATLRYAAPNVTATLGTDLSLKGGALRTVVRGGASVMVNDRLTVTADTLNEFGPSRGDRFGLGASLRDGPWQALATARYVTGSLAGNAPALTAQADVEYHRAAYALRGGVAARALPTDPDSFTWQPLVGSTYYFSDRLGLGAAWRASLQPATGTALYSYGLEGSARVLPGTWLTVGYNFAGFEGVTSTPTRPGLYLRLDLTADEVRP